MVFLLWIYNLAWYFALPVVYALLVFKSWRLKSYGQHLGQRFGFYQSKKPIDVWVHAVSVGEVVAATPVIEACLNHGQAVLVTTMTPTGLEQVKRLWGHRVSHQYVPYDFSFAIQRFLKDRQPKVLLIFETELWPGIIYRCYKRHIPVLLMNARLSDRSFPRYLKLKFFWRRLFQFFTAIYCQSEQDKHKFQQLGVNDAILKVSGNLKFNQLIQANKVKVWQDFKSHYSDKRVIVFGSTHQGEESLCIEIIKDLYAHHQDLLFILVPRHPERFDKVYQLLEKQLPQLQLGRYSQWNHTMPPLDCLLVDGMGELASLYSIAFCAFVGGSLVPVGGHNILEPLAFDVPVLTGPYMQNQKDLLRILQINQAIIYGQSWQDLAAGIGRLLSEKQYRKTLIENAKAMLSSHQQALGISMEGITKALNKT